MLKVKISDIFDFEKGSLQSSKNTSGEYDFITASSEWKTHNEYTHECEAIIVAVAASGSLGRTHYVNGKFISSDLCYILQPKKPLIQKVNLKFYHLYFNYIREDLVYKTATGSAKKAINQQNFANYEIVFPDISYQEMVVEKLNIINPNFNNFSDINYENDNYINKLRKAILQEAVQGKLVEQDPNDEPASELLKKIKDEKEKLIKEGEIKKEKPLPPISQSEIPYDLPKGWEWCRVNDYCDIGTGTTPTSTNSEYYDGNINWVTSTLTSSDFITTTEKCITEKAMKDFNLKLYLPKTLIIALYGQGKTRGQISELMIPATINQACASIRNIIDNETLKSYTKLFFKKHYEEIRELAAGCAQPNLNLSKIKTTLIPFPPLEEQKRIVKKTDELMALCDELENQVKESKQTSEQLMQAVLQEVFKQ